VNYILTKCLQNQKYDLLLICLFIYLLWQYWGLNSVPTPRATPPVVCFFILLKNKAFINEYRKGKLLHFWGLNSGSVLARHTWGRLKPNNFSKHMSVFRTVHYGAEPSAPVCQ
jgi:hypothetical protein